MPTESGGITGYVAEGPYAITEGGHIALFWSTFTEQGYCVVKSKAEDIFGEYIFEKFIFREDGGHAMILRKSAESVKSYSINPIARPTNA